MNAQQMYLNLLKKTLTYSLWDEPPTPIEFNNHLRSAPKQLVVKIVSFLLRKKKIILARSRNRTKEDILNGKGWPLCADTMIGLKRLDNIQYCVEQIIANKIPGDFLEAGVWRGGASIFLRALLAIHNIEDRKVYLADSFEGLPKPNPEAYPHDINDSFYKFPFLAISQQQVEFNFQKYDLLNEQVCFVKGWFKDSLPKLGLKNLALLRLDADMYESTMDVLENLYHKLSIGGYCIVDDYSLSNCKAAITEFRFKNGINDPILEIDEDSVFWKKQ